jgi:lysophospholipase L1-like esterase
VLTHSPVLWADVRAGELPGADPAALGLQPLEGDFETLRGVGDVLRRAEAGVPVRLSFFGASHTAGDYFTGELRRTLQARHGDRGHGFVLPAPLYEGDRANDINLCASDGWRSDWAGRKGGREDGLLGFNGASVSSSDPADFAWIQTTTDNPMGRAISRVEVFTLGHPAGGSYRLVVDEAPARVIDTHRPQPELLRHVFELPDGPHRVSVSPVGDGELRLFGMLAERDGPGVLVDAIGVRGRTARSWLSWDPALQIPGLLALNPDLIVLAYGTNEAADSDWATETYRDDLRQVLSRMREALPETPCVLIGPSDRGVEVQKARRYQIWGRTAPVAQVQREVAPEFGCGFWDWQLAAGGPGSMLSWRAVDPPLAGPDLIHFSQAGYRRSAELFLLALEDAAEVTGGLR